MTNSLMDRLKLYRQILEQKLHEDNFVSSGFGKIESWLISLFVLNLVVGYGAHLLVMAVGILYPAYRSVKAIESQSKEDDTKWLTYWVVFAFIELTESIAFVVLYFVPFYNLMKCLFLLYCMAPIQNNGSQLMYQMFIQPFVMKHADQIDTVGGDISRYATDFMTKS
ncbi:Receptor expression-enhancing protein 5 [Cichlidogyrus casuarinus]|uniref:Receptor expression-enhancing protein n=1 Tax=Cichlidogyrus casuarinus TaxID=1844966 RepID=A0ABD2Q6Z2_9PLAT